MTKPTFNIELLPEGVFLITLKGGEKIKGKFSMYALDRFAESKNLQSYFEVIAKISVGMKLREYAELIVFALGEGRQ